MRLAGLLAYAITVGVGLSVVGSVITATTGFPPLAVTVPIAFVLVYLGRGAPGRRP